MAEEKKKPRPGKKTLMDTLKRSQKKNADVRARSKAQKPSGGTLTERAKKLPKAAGGPPEKKNVPALRRTTEPAVRKANLPAKADGGSRSVVPRKDNLPVTRKDNLPAKAGNGASPKSNFGSGLGGTVARGLYRTIGGPAVMLASMTTPAGEGSDKPKGPLMKGGRTPGYKYDPIPADPNRGIGAAGKRDAETPKARPPMPKARPARTVTKPAERKTFAKKAEAPKAETPRFRGNWVGAAPTAMQSRAGMRNPPKVKRTGSMRDK